MKTPLAIIRQFNALRWKEALTPELFQRLNLHMFLTQMLLLLVVVVLVFAAKFLSLLVEVPVIGSLAVGVALAGFVVSAVWFIYMMTKLQVMRLRDLGFATRGVVTMLVVFTLLPTLYTIYEGYDHYMTYGIDVPMAVSAAFLMLLVPQALFTYWLYFESEPLLTTQKTPVAQTGLQAPKRIERAFIFLLQAFTWYGILSVPVDVIFH
ncbi:MAG: hypothetical protein DI585_00530 [Pseudomonas fluorescens]|nr:MAG: hypothetical protein DI585_00530 [Pseudomonas fluorescens]